jgi:hypothetical protein
VALSFVAASAWVHSGSTSGVAAPALPSGWAVGDALSLGIVNKQVGASITTPTGWTFQGRIASANGAAYGATAGDVAVSIYTRVATAGQAAPTIPSMTGGSTNNTSGNAMSAYISCWRNDTKGWGFVFSGAAQSAAAQNWSTPLDSPLAAVAGDTLVSVAGYGNLSGTAGTHSSASLASSLTVTSANVPVSASTTTGADQAVLRTEYASPTSRSITGLVFTKSNTTLVYGAVGLLLLREVAAGSASSPVRRIGKYTF